MTPRFAQAVDPLMLHVLGMLERINRGERQSPQDERAHLRALLDRAEAIVGSTPDWGLAKYALVSWIDEVLVETAWDGAEWWSNNAMEVEIFQSRLCNEQFYTQAQRASALPTRDALEVFYVCVVLGFRGLYRDPEMAAMFTSVNNLPADLETWAKQTAMAIRLGQGRPPLTGVRRELTGAPPLKMRPLAVWSWLAFMLLTTGGVVYYALYAS